MTDHKADMRSALEEIESAATLLAAANARYGRARHALFQDARQGERASSELLARQEFVSDQRLAQAIADRLRSLDLGEVLQHRGQGRRVGPEWVAELSAAVEALPS